MQRQRAQSDATCIPVALSSGRWKIVSAWTSSSPSATTGNGNRPVSQPSHTETNSPKTSTSTSTRKRVSLFLKRRRSTQSSITQLSMHLDDNKQQKPQDENPEPFSEGIRRAKSTGIATRNTLFDDLQKEECHRDTHVQNSNSKVGKENNSSSNNDSDNNDDIIGEICLENFAEDNENENNNFDFLDGQSLDLNVHDPNGDCHNVTLDVRWEDKDFDFDITSLFKSFIIDENNNNSNTNSDFNIDEYTINEWKKDCEEHNKLCKNWNNMCYNSAFNNTSNDIRHFINEFNNKYKNI